jgi:Helix-turn-helix domain
MTKKPTATQQVLTALAEGQRLTALDALQRFDLQHLASCIRELKTKGWPIKSKMIETPNTRKHVAVYWLGDKA